MSHVTTINIEIRDLEALKAACAELGVSFIEDKTTYKWYGEHVGEHVGDYPLPKGIAADQLGACSHVIAVPGVEYEVGVVRKSNGQWTLAYDFWGPGQGLLKKFGPNCQKLVQLYGVHKTTREARQKGFSVLRKNQVNGKIKLTILGT